VILSHEKRFLFAAFNKTASTSMEEALSPYRSGPAQRELQVRYEKLHPNAAVFKHARPLHLKQLLGDHIWESYLTFTFVRNPWSRLASLYQYHRKQPYRWPLAQKSFAEWLRAGGTGSARRTMSKFVSDDDGRLIVRFVGRYENLEADFARACEEAGLPRLDLPHRNRSTAGGYRCLYDDETRQIVARLAHSDIEMFGYEF
jgi:hypothetical protein